MSASLQPAIVTPSLGSPRGVPMAEAFGMSVAACSPLAGGVLSGKFTRPGGAEAGTRLAPESLSDHAQAVARVVQELADELGVTASQAAIAWTMA